ncbi:MAG: hypothetical protein KAJ46_01235 [Sedimentisphaerales bacterium]|nr:hypothetical protein [Sedimentisphaerales bacterium]
MAQQEDNGEQATSAAECGPEGEEQSCNEQKKRNYGRRQTDQPRTDTTDRRDGWDRRRGPGRRRSDERRAAEEGEMDDEQFVFIMAIDEYKRANKRPFPSYTEILEIAKALGYRKVAEPQALSKPSSK